MEIDPKGRVVIASCALARRAVEAGAEVVVVFDKDATELSQTIAAVDPDIRVAAFLGDPANESELQAAIAFAVEQFLDAEPILMLGKLAR